MDLDHEFLILANNLKKIIEQDEKVVNTHSSQYNLFMDTKDRDAKSTETHHIKEQHLFDENKMGDHLPKII